jgi:hypothetical protein
LTLTRNTAAAVLALSLVATPANAAGAAPSCKADALEHLAFKGTIRFVGSTVRPIIGPGGVADYSITDTIDEYEMALEPNACGLAKLRVRFEYGHVRSVACADNVEAKASGFLRRDADNGALFLSIVSPSELVCKPPD